MPCARARSPGGSPPSRRDGKSVRTRIKSFTSTSKSAPSTFASIIAPKRSSRPIRSCGRASSSARSGSRSSSGFTEFDCRSASRPRSNSSRPRPIPACWKSSARRPSRRFASSISSTCGKWARSTPGTGNSCDCASVPRSPSSGPRSRRWFRRPPRSRSRAGMSRCSSTGCASSAFAPSSPPRTSSSGLRERWRAAIASCSSTIPRRKEREIRRFWKPDWGSSPT